MTRRDDPAWCTPAHLPDELHGFDGSVRDGLGVGAPGKLGVLDLALAPRGGTTRVVRQYQRAPLHIYRPIHLDPHRPDMAFVFLQQQGDGFVQGDRYRVDVDCADGSAVHLTTQASTKVYGARDNYATQLLNLRAGAGAVLEYLPDPVVPFRGSRLYQRTTVTLAPDATVLLGEVLLPGRVARGETHCYDLYRAELEARRTDGALLFADTLRLRPGGAGDPGSPATLGGYQVVGSFTALSDRMPPAELVAALRAELAPVPEVFAGVSELPAGCGAGVRVLGHTSKAVQAAMHAAWDRARRCLLGIPAPDLRKG
ncbi:urease accessory protein UreD [Amycolatopsis rhabdoformis]|uniref:Urease accessory protein UreD n=1 Tax=Amycolatopsis rhabdoformis TaxID=1448059 RepID=A0ABZ1IDY9_9PSEU|nr:urease accessory protein UreD [Amycolatopsis rhabdoformis]WSE32686.1 urease accessory protein UreD [Amycolatopsis rhabdoformis]